MPTGLICASNLDRIRLGFIAELLHKDMDEIDARALLDGAVRRDNGLEQSTPFIRWYEGAKEVALDGRFTAAQLEAIAWWMRNKS